MRACPDLGSYHHPRQHSEDVLRTQSSATKFMTIPTSFFRADLVGVPCDMPVARQGRLSTTSHGSIFNNKTFLSISSLGRLSSMYRPQAKARRTGDGLVTLRTGSWGHPRAQPTPWTSGGGAAFMPWSPPGWPMPQLTSAFRTSAQTGRGYDHRSLALMGQIASSLSLSRPRRGKPKAHPNFGFSPEPPGLRFRSSS